MKAGAVTTGPLPRVISTATEASSAEGRLALTNRWHGGDVLATGA